MAVSSIVRRPAPHNRSKDLAELARRVGVKPWQIRQAGDVVQIYRHQFRDAKEGGGVGVRTTRLGPLPPIWADAILGMRRAKWRGRWAMPAPAGWAERSNGWSPAIRNSRSPYNESSGSSLMANVALTPNSHMAKRFGLQSVFRPPGRPCKENGS